MKKRAALIVPALALLFSLVIIPLVSPAPLEAQSEPFFKGKTIKIVVGFTPSGFYDRWARVVARHMGKHIPGNPEIIVQNMPGAASVVAANYVYGVAKPDGLTVGMPSANIYMDQLVGRQETKFDVRRFQWIGTQDKRHLVFYMRSDTPYKSVGDIVKAKEPPKCGETGTTSSGYLLTRIVHEVLGGKLNELMDQYKTPDINRRVVRVILAGAEFGSPIFAAPGTATERVKFLREAHAKSMKD